MRKDLTGVKIAHLTALKFQEFKNRKTYWLYQCDCGNQKIIRSDQVGENDTQSCGCQKLRRNEELRIEKTKDPGMGMSTVLYHKYKLSAKRRHHNFSLTIDQFRELTQQDCNYCGLPPSQVSYKKEYNGPHRFNGIDRRDNKQGYIIENAVPCCKTCNQAKHTMTEEDFLSWIKRITEFNAGKHR